MNIKRGKLICGLMLMICLQLMGCTVIKDARTELRREVVGFKYNWNKYVLKKEDELY